jgi:hypothetical protein
MELMGYFNSIFKWETFNFPQINTDWESQIFKFFERSGCSLDLFCSGQDKKMKNKGSS